MIPTSREYRRRDRGAITVDLTAVVVIGLLVALIIVILKNHGG